MEVWRKKLNDVALGFGRPNGSNCSKYQISAFLADHAGGHVRVGVDDERHDRGVRHAQALHPVNAQMLVCARAGVRDATLLDDCTLDVSLLRADTAADAFVNAPVHAPAPARDLRPYP